MATNLSADLDRIGDIKKIDHRNLIIYTMECLICFGDQPEYSCNNPQCQNKICGNCLSQHFRLSVEGNSLPLCPIRGCYGAYRYRQLDKAFHADYLQGCINYFDKREGGRILFEVNKEDIIEKLRNARSTYLQTNFPKAIHLTARIALSSKLKKIKKVDLEKNRKKLTRRCRNTGCLGMLDESNSCTLCRTEFCNQCDKRVLSGHICNNDDIASLKFIKEMIKCPKCQVSVERSEGCDNMTCSSCGQRFLYSTGQAGGYGSHNEAIIVNERHSLTTILEDYLNKLPNKERYINLIKEIEMNGPKKPIDSGLIKLLAESKKKGITENLRERILRSFEHQHNEAMLYKRYIDQINEIETGVIKGTMMIEQLEKIHRLYNE